MKVRELKHGLFDRDAIIKLLKNKTCFVAVFSQSCIHCVNMKPSWNELKKNLKQMKSDSVVLEIDYSQLEFINYGPLKNSIRGLPAIMIFKNGMMIKNFTGNRTVTEMSKFFEPHLDKSIKKTIKNKKLINKKTIKNKKLINKKQKRIILNY